MSRGPGWIEKAVVWTIRRHGKPMSFEDIRAHVRRARAGYINTSLERSIRRALHRMVSNSVLISLGDGGRGDPFRYFLHPMLIGIMCSKEEGEALLDAVGPEWSMARGLILENNGAARADDVGDANMDPNEPARDRQPAVTAKTAT